MRKALIISIISIVCFEVLMAQSNHQISKKGRYYGIEGVIPFEYNFIFKNPKGGYIVGKGFLDEDKLEEFVLEGGSKEIEQIRKAGGFLLGLFTEDGKLLIPCKYNYLSYFEGYNYLVGMGEFEYTDDLFIKEYVKNAKFGIYNTNLQREVVSCKYAYIEPFHSNYYKIAKGDVGYDENMGKTYFNDDVKMGLYDKVLERTMLPIKYKYIGEITNNKLIVSVDNNAPLKKRKHNFYLDGNPEEFDYDSDFKLGVYDIKLKKFIIPPKYKRILPNVACTQYLTYNKGVDSYNGTIDYATTKPGFELFGSDGNKITNREYFLIDNSIENAIIKAFTLSEIGNLDYFETYKRCSEWAYSISLNYKIKDQIEFAIYRLVDSKGTDLLNGISYNYIGKFIKGMALVYKGTYEAVQSNSKGEFKMSNPIGKFGYINTKGEEIIPLIYDKAESFNDGKALVEKDGREFYIDNKGKELTE